MKKAKNDMSEQLTTALNLVIKTQQDLIDHLKTEIVRLKSIQTNFPPLGPMPVYPTTQPSVLPPPYTTITSSDLNVGAGQTMTGAVAAEISGAIRSINSTTVNIPEGRMQIEAKDIKHH